MASKQTQTAFPFVGILQLIFITLKLTGHITWSWLWVLSPIWGIFAAAFVVLAIVAAASLRGGARGKGK